MIKLSDLTKNKNLKTDIPHNPFKSSKYDWTDDDDMNMSDEEWEEFETDLEIWTDDMRKRKLTNKMVDVDGLITDWLLMDKSTKDVLQDLSSKEINKISKILQKKRERGDVCSLYKKIGIKYLGDRGKLKYDWEKDYYDKHHKL